MPMPKPDWIIKLEQEPCRCVECGSCAGTGYEPHELSVDDVTRSFQLSEREPCDYCQGGIIEVCDRCQALEEYDNEQMA